MQLIKSMSVKLILLLSLMTFSLTQIVPFSDNFTSAPSNSSSLAQTVSNFTFTDIPLNLSSINDSISEQLDNCLSLINDSNVFLDTFQLGAALKRLYSDGYAEYYLYLDVNDANGNIHQFQSVVSISNYDYPVYTIEKIT